MPQNVMNPTTELLNERFANAGHVTFVSGPGGLPCAEVSNRSASGRICLLGAHVMEFRPHAQPPVLWMSRCSDFEVGKPIRGGIPVCWPWFGPHPTDRAESNHGFVRRILWDVKSVTCPDEGVTVLQLCTASSPETLSEWPYAFRVELTVTFSTELTVELAACNTGDEAFSYNDALHSYFTVSDIRKVSVEGLGQCSYIDTVGPRRRLVQDGPIRFTAETDRIYVDTENDTAIVDPGLARRICIAKAGSRSTVVWNPWIDKSRRMEDFGDDEYLGMVCVETTNADEDAIHLPPGGEHCLRAVIRTAD